VALDLVRALHQSGDARAKELFLTSLAAMVTAAGDAIDPLVREELAAGVQGSRSASPTNACGGERSP
jgi:hypothetical protein